jgi:hypothetical protein
MHLLYYPTLLEMVINPQSHPAHYCNLLNPAHRVGSVTNDTTGIPLSSGRSVMNNLQVMLYYSVADYT